MSENEQISLPYQEMMEKPLPIEGGPKRYYIATKPREIFEIYRDSIIEHIRKKHHHVSIDSNLEPAVGCFRSHGYGGQYTFDCYINDVGDVHVTVIEPIEADDGELANDMAERKRRAQISLYVRRQIIQPIQLDLSEGIPKSERIKHNYDLSQYEYECPQHQYTTRIIERKPLIIYIEQFLTENEIQHLIELAEPLFKPTKVYDINEKVFSDDHPTSSSTNIKRHATSIVNCIEQRFAQFQGDMDAKRIEPLHIVKYTSNQQMKPHFDWFTQPNLLKNGGQRVSTFITYLQANCSMGETEFLQIQFNKSLHEHFCDILICDENSGKSDIRFRPLPGNSIFWSNINELKQVEHLTYHSGRPPGENGYKIELNTWTRESSYSVLREK
ncbi:unnamed protein product [Adineta steineri]|uniref:Prolyl 4-hydroxylase alpha subunit domain-containing protein n=1 Tax=Adineta steineri TaxID=433720 RepID=A0A818YU38_9BILA|nr:unnamed protein product [Adineta steineri]CAF1348407.1 unnamed protein product [Adineta steineri]CAF3761336.1 unnamed protein product [Adineta steineri]CAF3790707.1 unnamed protein product [Adineta steineri]